MSTKLIRRALIASGLFVGATVAFSPTAFANNSTTVNIGGNVATTLAISSSSPNTAIDLTSGQTGATSKVAALTMGTNNATGLTVTTSGTFTLVNGNNRHVTDIPFKVGIGVGASTIPSTYGVAGSTQSGIATSTATDPTTVYGLYIQYDTATVQDAGAYDAAITLTVADNS